MTTGQIVVFGLTGGLIPCPASITVLLLCLQVGKVGLGALLVLCFSLGLAITMVLVGVGAALSVRHVSWLAGKALTVLRRERLISPGRSFRWWGFIRFILASLLSAEADLDYPPGWNRP